MRHAIVQILIGLGAVMAASCDDDMPTSPSASSLSFFVDRLEHRGTARADR